MILFLKENLNIGNFNNPSVSQQIDEIDDISNSISDNISKEISIPKDVLNSFAIKPDLNDKLWTNGKLNPTVRTKLVKIANDFFKELNLPENVKMKDVIFTGSLANYNWSKYSDIDLHIVLDFDQIEGKDQFKEDFFYAQKTIWNQSHDITVYEYPVELYAQDVHDKLVATAVYSVKNDKWVLKPTRETFKINKKVIKQKAERFIARLKDIRRDYEQHNLESVIEKVKSLKTKIKNYRTSGLESGGEFSIENLVFKTLRRTPFMDILDSYKAKAYDKLMSVKENITEAFIDDVTFNFENEYDDDFKIEAFYENEQIGKVFFSPMYDPYQEFEDDFTEDEIEKYFGDGNTFVLEWIEVPDDYYRNSGIGRVLMQKAIEKIKELGGDKIYLNASPLGNAINLNNLVRFYESFGFKTIKDQGGNKLMLLILNNNIMENYRNVIKESLRQILEVRSRFDSSKADLFRTMFKVAKAYDMFGPNSSQSDEVKEYFNNTEDGQWVAPIIVHANGEITVGGNIAPAKDIMNTKLGVVKTTATYMAINICAGRGVEHDNNGGRSSFAISRNGLKSSEEEMVGNLKALELFKQQKFNNIINSEDPNTSIKVNYDVAGSPASDAAIKAYLNYGYEIIDFVLTRDPNYNAYTSHSDAKDSEKYQQMMADPTAFRKKLRMDFRTKYKELIGKEPSEEEIQNFLSSDEDNVENYLQNNGVKKTERNLVDPSRETGEERKARMDAERERKRQELKAKREKRGL